MARENPSGCCGVPTVCCEDTVPQTLHVEVGWLEGPGCEGFSFDISYNAAEEAWFGSGSNGSATLGARLRCIGETWMLLFTQCAEAAGPAGEMMLHGECEPFNMSSDPAEPTLVTTCCDGKPPEPFGWQIRITVTE